MNLSGKSAADGPVTVQLGPCGMAMMRLVDPAGDPVAGHAMAGWISIVASPGPSPHRRRDPGDERLDADETPLIAFDRDGYRGRLTSDGRGRLTLPALIPGTSYRIYDGSTIHDPAGIQLRREFTAEAGAAVELGDVLIERPARADR